MNDMSTLGIFLIVVFVAMAISLVFFICSVITLWKLFSKAGQPGWAALVPVYNLMVLARIGDRPMWVGVTAGILSVLVYVIQNLSTLFSYSDSMEVSAIYDGALIVSLLMYAILIGLSIYITIGCIRKYDKGVLIWLLYWLVPVIAVFVVGKVNYIGSGVADNKNLEQNYSGGAPRPIAAQIQPNQSTQFATSQAVEPQASTETSSPISEPQGVQPVATVDAD